MTPLSAAVTQIGVVEERGNRGVPLTRYGITGEDPLPWCARFVRWCFTQAGLILPGNRYLIGNVATMHDELEAHGALVSEPRAGDLIFMHTRGASDAGVGHHVGIVENADALTVASIDGNLSDRVRRMVRDRLDPQIWCFARWPVAA